LKETRLFFKKFIESALVLGLQLFILSASIVSADIRPAAIVKLPENERVILIEKKTQTLFLYALEDKDLKVQFQVPCSTGEAYGTKQESGDKKTPEGIYFLNDEFEDKYLSPIYGKKAFPTDYPNLIDKRAGKNGSAIWIHGTNKPLKPMDSNGCIALENANILKLSDHITLHSTPVIMVETIDRIQSPVLVQQEQDIDLVLNQWTKAIENGTYHEYLSFYSSDYLPGIQWWDAWLTIRKTAQKTGSALVLQRDRTGIYAHEGVFVALFDSFLANASEKILLGKRKLFLENINGEYKIVGDVFQTISPQFQTGNSPLTAAAGNLVTPVLKTESVIEMLNHWLSAWSSKDMDQYAGFYADNFYSDGMNKKKWVTRKKALAKKYAFIHVSGQEFKVKQTKKTCEVSFFQEYESSGLTTRGTKKLKLVNKGGLWKIYQESWKEK
jgi:murein L,D-transpeptidase YafK